MISFYHRMFYHLYKLAIKTGEKTAPLTSALPALSFLLLCNLMLIDLLLEMLGIGLLSSLNNNTSSNFYYIFFVVIMLVANYIYFMSDQRYKKLVDEYSKRPIEERKKWARITLIYALVSIALIFILAPL